MRLNQRPSVRVNGLGGAHGPDLSDPGNLWRATAGVHGPGGEPPSLLLTPEIRGALE
jgi:hypothetical protein